MQKLLRDSGSNNSNDNKEDNVGDDDDFLTKSPDSFCMYMYKAGIKLYSLKYEVLSLQNVLYIWFVLFCMTVCFGSKHCVNIFSENAITIENGTFTWDKKLGPCLKE